MTVDTGAPGSGATTVVLTTEDPPVRDRPAAAAGRSRSRPDRDRLPSARRGDSRVLKRARMSHHDRPRYVPIEHLPPAGSWRLSADRRARRRPRISPGSASAAVYTSPYFAAAPGSTHGYDVSNHNEINPELGGTRCPRGVRQRGRRARPAPHRRLRAESHGHRHRHERVVERRARERSELAVREVLRHRLGAGRRRSCYAKLLLPILGDQYGHVLERGELQLVFRDGALGAALFRPRAADQSAAGAARLSRGRRPADRRRSEPTTRSCTSS